jgi:hypothetical protein
MIVSFSVLNKVQYFTNVLNQTFNMSDEGNIHHHIS